MMAAGDDGSGVWGGALYQWLFGRQATALDIGPKWQYAVVARRGYGAALAGVLDRQCAQGDDKENCSCRG
jgi:hypothetical protein